MITSEQLDRYERDGYLVVPGGFSPDEVENLKAHYMDLRAAGKYPGDFDGVDLTSSDPLKRFPRMIHMHRWDEDSLQWLLDTRLRDGLTALLGREPLAVQTMLYFKPAGARGQALHQDNFYLRVQPGTCMAAWLALDPCDEENGCMQVVPGSHTLPVLCTQRADTTKSFTDVTVPLPEGLSPVPVLMNAGDVLFFNGSLIHGSFPNTSEDRFRRSLIGHYIAGEAEKVGGFYDPVLRMDGTRVILEHNDGSGPCGIWREQDGQNVVEMTLPAEPELVLHE
jgi:phytanoyl-CoA hydroxylase